MNLVQQITAANAGRDPQRLALKYNKMRSSAFAFLRGSCQLFYERLPKNGIFRTAPLVWVCGDLHLENFGSYKGDNRLVYFDLNDFDEAALAPASWDLIRLLTSILVGADSTGLREVEAQTLCTAFLDSYFSTLSSGKAYWLERDTAQGPIQTLLESLRTRQRAPYLDTRTTLKGKKRLLRIDGKKALPVSEQQRSTVTAFMADFAKTQTNPGFYDVLDVAQRIAGTGSLGLERYVILVNGKGSPNGNYLLDLKLAVPSSLTPFLTAAQPKWTTQAHRVVTLQQRLQAVSMAFLHPVRMGKKSYVLRGLQPSEDRVTLDRSSLSLSDFMTVIQTMGQLVAWAHLRSAGREGSASADGLIEFGQGKKWKDLLRQASQACAAQVRTDADQFNAAYDEGAFAV